MTERRWRHQSSLVLSTDVAIFLLKVLLPATWNCRRKKIDIEIPFDLIPYPPARQVVSNEFNGFQCHAVHTRYIPSVFLLCRTSFVLFFAPRLACATKNS